MTFDLQTIGERWNLVQPRVLEGHVRKGPFHPTATVHIRSQGSGGQDVDHAIHIDLRRNVNETVADLNESRHWAQREVDYGNRGMLLAAPIRARDALVLMNPIDRASLDLSPTSYPEYSYGLVSVRPWIKPEFQFGTRLQAQAALKTIAAGLVGMHQIELTGDPAREEATYYSTFGEVAAREPHGFHRSVLRRGVVSYLDDLVQRIEAAPQVMETRIYCDWKDEHIRGDAQPHLIDFNDQWFDAPGKDLVQFVKDVDTGLPKHEVLSVMASSYVESARRQGASVTIMPQVIAQQLTWLTDELSAAASRGTPFGRTMIPEYLRTVQQMDQVWSREMNLSIDADRTMTMEM